MKEEGRGGRTKRNESVKEWIKEAGGGARKESKGGMEKRRKRERKGTKERRMEGSKKKKRKSGHIGVTTAPRISAQRRSLFSDVRSRWVPILLKMYFSFFPPSCSLLQFWKNRNALKTPNLFLKKNKKKTRLND